MKSVKSVKKINPEPVYDITVANEHCFILANGVVAHNSMYPTKVVSGGTGQYYAADNIYIIGRQQNKDSEGVSGYNFVVNVEKSRYVREKSKIPITVSFDKGVFKWSGLLDLALDTGHVVKPSNGWYTRPEIDEDGKKFREKDTQTSEFWIPVLTKTDFAAALKSKFQLSLQEMEETTKVDYATGEVIDEEPEADHAIVSI